MEERKGVPRAGESREEERAEEGNEEELDTYAVIPPNGGWGWVVVVGAFYCNVVVDGIQLTFGVFLSAISKSFGVEVAEVALAGSMAFAAATFRPLKPVKVQVVPAASPDSEPDSRKSSSSQPGEPSERRKTVFVKTNPSGGRSGTSLITVHNAIWNFAGEAVVSDRRKQTCPSCWRLGKRRKRQRRSDVLVLSEVKSEALGQRRKSYVEQGVLHESGSESGSREGVYVPEEVGEGQRRAVFRRLVVRPRMKGCDAIKRTMKAMLDCHLMGHLAFVVFTISGAFQMAGFLIVFIYEKERSIKLGFTEEMGDRKPSKGKQVNYWALAIAGIVLGGLATICSDFHESVYYQFGFCFLFGLGIASFAVFRVILLVDLVGMERIENATGINLLFMGILCIVSPPFFGWLMELTDSYNVVFITTGVFIVLSGLVLIGLNKKKIEK